MTCGAALRPRSLFLSPGGVLQHRLVWGESGPDMILVPGITSPAALWGFVAERLAAFARVHVVDVRGRGLSDHRPDLSYRERDCAADILALADTLDRPILLGHSMGARIGVAAAARAPERFRCLIAVDPPVSGPGRRPYPAQLDWYLEAIAEVSNGGGIEAARRAVPHWNEEQVALRATWLPTCSVEAVTQAYHSFHEDSMHDLLPAVACPSLLIYAEQGGVISDADAAEIVNLLPSGRAVRIDGAGHMIPWDQLDAFVETVRDYLTRQA